MEKKYAHLLSPVKVNGKLIKNRILTPNASPLILQGPQTYPAEAYCAYFAGLARNGAAILDIADSCYYPKQRVGDINHFSTHVQAFDRTDPSVMNCISAMVDEIHFYGSKALVFLDLDFPAGYNMTADIPFGVVIDKTIQYKVVPKEMIPEIIEMNLERVRYFRKCGFDGYAMRADYWMEPQLTPRDDEYGGNLENRTRFILEFYRRLKEEFGPDFITEAAFAGEQPNGYQDGVFFGGYTLDDAIEFAKLAEDCIDIIQLREKDKPRCHPSGYVFQQGQHTTIEYAAAFKAAGVKQLIAPIGGFQDPDEIESYLADGKCDMIGMARAFIADFEFGKKLYEGRGEDIVPCLRCNLCMAHHTDVSMDHPTPWVDKCAVNPLMGYQHKVHRFKSEPQKQKRVAIIGGGPAGIRAALYIKEKGHLVTLYEKTGALGGLLKKACAASFNWPMDNYRKWLVRQLEKAKVDVRLNTEATAGMIADEGYDVAVLAIGARNTARMPEGVYSCYDVLGNPDLAGDSTVIVGGSVAAVQVGLYLSQQGRKVTLLCPEKELAYDCGVPFNMTQTSIGQDERGVSVYRKAWQDLAELNGIVNAAVQQVSPSCVVYQDAGGEHRLTCDTVLICDQMQPRHEEALAFYNGVPEFYMIGDCAELGGIQKCTQDAFAVSNMI